MTVRSATQYGSLQKRYHDRPVNVYNATGTGAVALSTTETGRFKLVRATIKLNTIPSTSEDAILTLNANDGAAYDAVIRRVNPSAGTNTGDVEFEGDDQIFEPGDQLDLSLTNTDARTYGALIVTEPV